MLVLLVLGELHLLLLGDHGQLELGIDIALSDWSGVSIRILQSWSFPDQPVKFQVVSVLDIEVQVDLGVLGLEELAELYRVDSLLEGTLVVVDLLTSLASHVRAVVHLAPLECLVVIGANTVLV